MNDSAREPRRRARTIIGTLATAAIALGLVLVPASANAVIYPVEVRATWTNLKGTSTAKVSATVRVVAFGSYPVTGSVQICEDTRCYGPKVKLSTSGSAKVSALVPRDAAGVKSLQVKYYGDGFVVVKSAANPKNTTKQFSDGVTAFEAGMWQSDQVEASIATYPTTTTAKLASSTVSQGAMVTIDATVKSGQPVIKQWVNGKEETVAKEPVAGLVTVYEGSTELKNVWVKDGKGRLEFKALASRFSKGKHKLTVKFRGSNLQAASTSASLWLTVK